MQCAYHPDREPVGACVACGKLICVECKAVLGGKYYCTPCADKIFVHKQVEPESKPEPAESTSKPAATAAPATKTQRPPQEKPPTPAPEKTTAAATAAVVRPETNESGMGTSSVLPEELKGWNWGAFFLNWIWGIGNSVWIALLCLIPFVNIVMAFVLGAKGNEWAWQNKKWDSIEHFKKTQRTWKRWGVALFIISIVLTVIYFVILAVVTMSGLGTVTFGP